VKCDKFINRSITWLVDTSDTVLQVTLCVTGWKRDTPGGVALSVSFRLSCHTSCLLSPTSTVSTYSTSRGQVSAHSHLSPVMWGPFH